VSLPLIYRVEVRDELDEAYAWYEDQRPGLGDEFLKDVQSRLDLIQANPELHAPIFRQVRRSLVKRFSSSIYYRVESSRIVVVAILHGRRDPERWRARI